MVLIDPQALPMLQPRHIQPVKTTFATYLVAKCISSIRSYFKRAIASGDMTE